MLDFSHLSHLVLPFFLIQFNIEFHFFIAHFIHFIIFYYYSSPIPSTILIQSLENPIWFHTIHQIQLYINYFIKFAATGFHFPFFHQISPQHLFSTTWQLLLNLPNPIFDLIFYLIFTLIIHLILSLITSNLIFHK